MSTFSEKNIDQNKKDWFIFDAKDQVVGRLATNIARILVGKHKPTFTRHVDTGDFVVVINAEKAALTGNKWSGKRYYDHSGYVGGLKEKTALELMAKHPDEILRRAVWGMINKTKLGRNQISKLKIYAGTEHPHKAQNPKPWAEPKRTVARITKKVVKKAS
ncbi:MAG: 50S ribosomal protein L13 [Deltaproteobacteria bacterium]|nr:50S ribosomal protein L13 [Deltaproteobacteria bacterium]